MDSVSSSKDKKNHHTATCLYEMLFDFSFTPLTEFVRFGTPFFHAVYKESEAFKIFLKSNGTKMGTKSNDCDIQDSFWIIVTMFQWSYMITETNGPANDEIGINISSPGLSLYRCHHGCHWSVSIVLVPLSLVPFRSLPLSGQST